MIISYKTLYLVKFPVYILPSDNWEEVDGLLYVDNELIDDKNVEQPTLGLRRLHTPFKKHLGALRKSVDDETGLLKQTSRFFIDSEGFPFIYEKQLWGTLKYKRILEVQKCTTHCLLNMDGVNFRFKVPRPPPPNTKYAGIIYLHKTLPWIIYDYSQHKLPDKKKKV